MTVAGNVARHAAPPVGGVLDVADLRKKFTTPAGVNEVLRGLSFSVRSGEWVSVMGQSGSGKSTLLRCASGLTGVTGGRAVVAGADITASSQDELARLRRSALGFIFQDYNLIETLTVSQNVALPLLLDKDLHKDSGDLAAAVSTALESTGVARLADQEASTLSGGEQQRVSIARALAQHPAVLFADEPTGALDSVNSRMVLDLFRRLTDQGSAVLMVTHDLDAAARGDRVLVLVDGTIRHDLTRPTAEQLFELLKESDQ